jgi:hypothetical protein
MLGRNSLAFLLVGGAVIPYVVSSNASIRDTLKAPLQAISGKSAKPPAGDGANATGAGTNSPAVPTAAATEARKASEVQLVPLEQALNWDVKPAWVLSTWPRVTTALPELDLQGYRVSFVSGTTENDIAGSLSYYFDEAQRLQRLTFHGSTGDAGRLVRYLMSQHRFERRRSDDVGTYLYQVPQDGQALSELLVKTAPVVSTTNRFARFEVWLQMRKPE